MFMQITPRYLVNNRVTVVADMAGLITEYKQVYQRHLMAYRGIDNTLQFKILNSDQKPIDLSGYEVIFQAFDESDSLTINRTATINQNIKGLTEVVISENDLLNYKDQYLSYSLHLVDEITKAKTLTYSDASFGACGTISIESCAYPGPKESYEVFSFVQDNDAYWYTESVEADPAINGNEALHTVVFYTDNYDGDITIQSTLENSIDGSSIVNWADIDVLSFNGTETTPVPYNFNGVYSYLRFVASKDPENKIIKILVRN